MTYPQDPQGWQQPGGGYPQQPDNGGYGQQPGGGGYDPGYGDPYAQPGGYQPTYDPTSGAQPQTPVSGGTPGAPPTGPLPPGYGYGQQPYNAPTSGYPTSGGYPPTGYPGTGYPGTGYPAAPPPKKSRAGLIIGIVAGVLLLLCVVGSIGTYAIVHTSKKVNVASGSATPTPSAPVSPSASASPSDPPLLAQFVDPDLKNFARRGTATADTCSVVTNTIPANNNASESVKCVYPGGFDVYWTRYKTLEDRDQYAQSARDGFSDKSVINDGNTFWTDDAGTRQGNYITGYNKNTNGRFLYWDTLGTPLSGEIYATSTDASATETFWKTIR